MGMTYEQFWEQDCLLVIPYRKAYKLRQEEQNRAAWLQGMYFYEGVSVAIARGFSKSGRNLNYPDKPYDLNPPKPKTQAEIVREEQERMFDRMQEMTMRYNRQFRERKAKEEEEKRKAKEEEEKRKDKEEEEKRKAAAESSVKKPEGDPPDDPGSSDTSPQ